MDKQPSIETERLVLRPLRLSDSKCIQRHAGDYRIAKTTENIPHPYADGMAEDWIKTLEAQWEAKKQAPFAVCLLSTRELIGYSSLSMETKHRRASLGYWIGTEYWKKGFATEAAGAVLNYGFNKLDLHRIDAQHFAINPASGAVMRKIGMKHEGTMRDYIIKNGVYMDMELYSKLA